MKKPMWQPSEERKRAANMTRFIDFINKRQWAFHNIERQLREKAGIDLRKEKLEYIPAYTGRLGNIRVDLDCKTTVKGLWALGDTCAQGSAWDGGRMREALGMIEEVRDEILPKIKGADPRNLVRYHEAASMTLCAEMVHRAS